MLGKQFCLVLLIVILFPTDVPGQKIEWAGITKSPCSDPNVVIEGERIILKAALSTHRSDSTVWALDRIYLKQYYYSSSAGDICVINVTRDGCHGPRQDLSCYCNSQSGDYYSLTFNFTVVIRRDLINGVRYLIRWTSPLTYSMSILYTLTPTVLYDYPYATTRLQHYKTYSVQDIINNNFVVSRESKSLYTSFTSSGRISYRYSDQSEVSSLLYSSAFGYNISVWDSHIDDVIQIKFVDQCSRNWSFTVPVTNLPELDCDPPELYWNKSTGFQLVTRCRIPRSRVIDVLMQQFECSSHVTSPNWYRSGSMTIEGDIFTCRINIPTNNLMSNTTDTMNIRWSPVIDTQFTNGSGQNPRVVRFSVNGSRSITVEPGSDVSFECKVYGNPTAVAVLVGTGLGRIQEERSDTDLLLTNLAKVQCEDSGRYTCKGVSGFGSTPGDRQAYVDVNVRCPPAVRSHVPSDINQKFNFDPGSNILVSLEVYGYPVPTDFGLQLGQGSSSSEVDKDQYSVTSVELNPSLAVLTLIIFSRDNGGPETYVFRISNGANSSLDFQFEAGEFETCTVTGEVSSPSPWMYAFIAVICIVGVSFIIIIIIYFIKKRFHNKVDNFMEITFRQLTMLVVKDNVIFKQFQTKMQTSPTATKQSETQGSIRLNNTSGSSSTEFYDKVTPDEEICENFMRPCTSYHLSRVPTMGEFPLNFCHAWVNVI